MKILTFDWLKRKKACKDGVSFVEKKAESRINVLVEESLEKRENLHFNEWLVSRMLTVDEKNKVKAFILSEVKKINPERVKSLESYHGSMKTMLSEAIFTAIGGDLKRYEKDGMDFKVKVLRYMWGLIKNK